MSLAQLQRPLSQEFQINDFDDDSNNFSTDDEDQGPLNDGFEVAMGHAGNEMLNAANFGLTTHAIAETKRRGNEGEEYDGGPPPSSAPQPIPAPKTTPTIQEKIQQPLIKPANKETFHVTAKMAEQGRKVMTEKLANEETYRKQKIVERIDQYYEYWPELKETAPKKGKFSTADSEKVLNLELERCMRNKNRRKTLDKVKKVDLMFNWGIEKIVGAFGVDARGLGYEAKLSQHMIEEELKELAMEYGDTFNTSVEFDYAMFTFQRLLGVIERNKQFALRGVLNDDVLDPTQQEALNKKYAEL